jgi:hypothetical protein
LRIAALRGKALWSVLKHQLVERSFEQPAEAGSVGLAIPELGEQQAMSHGAFLIHNHWRLRVNAPVNIIDTEHPVALPFAGALKTSGTGPAMPSSEETHIAMSKAVVALPPAPRNKAFCYYRYNYILSAVTRSPSSTPALNSSRLGKRLQVALGAAAAALAAISLTPGSAQAIVVTVDSVEYDVTTFTGSYNDNIGKFATAANGGVMPWWGDQPLASAFATSVGLGLGLLNLVPSEQSTESAQQSAGPYFAIQVISDSIVPPFGDAVVSAACVDSRWTDPNECYTRAGYNQSFDKHVTWAQATVVPGPLPALGVAAAFGFSRKLRKRIKISTNAVSSTNSL